MKKNTFFLTCLSLCALPAWAQNSPAQIQIIQSPGNGQTRVLSPEEVKMMMQQQQAAPGRSPSNASQQGKMKLLRQLQIDRSTSGIIETRLAEKHKPTVVPELSEEEIKKLPSRQQTERFHAILKQIRVDVTLSNWERFSKTLASLPENEASQIYSHVLQQLTQPAKVTPSPEISATGARPHTQAQYFPANEVLPLAAASPKALDSGTIKLLARLISGGTELLPDFYEQLDKGNKALGKTTPETALNTAELLISAGLLDHVAGYLPTPDEAKKSNNFKATDLISQYHTAAHQARKGKEHLALAWGTSTLLLSEKEAPYDKRVSALYRALSLLPDLQEDTSSKWLKESFATTDAVGYEILSAVGILSSQTRENRDADFRLEQLKIQSAAVNTLLENTKVSPSEWSELLTLYLRNWNQEAEHSYRYDTSTSLRPEMQADSYGNIFYMSRQRSQTNHIKVLPIRSGDLLSFAPSEKWLSLVEDEVRLNYLVDASKLYLKVKEEEKAFPLLETIAQYRPDQAKGLVREMINVWAENHNPNTQNNRYRSSYFYMYGMNQKAEAIPLTRSKQERNLKQLAQLIKKVASLNLGDTFQREFASAFVAAHSTAEVWRLETLEAVFGPMETMNPEVVNSLLSQMRTNLAGLWPDPKLQIEAKTKRTDKELQQQIIKGYAMAKQLCESSLEKYPDNWKLQVNHAALVEEESNYLSSISSHSSHTINKQKAMELFAAGAAKYASKLPLDKTSDESITPYTQWFFGALGSPILQALKNHHQPIPSEYAKIKEALDFITAVDEAAGERHMAMFADALNKSLASVAPDLKFRYLKAAISIVGDHPKFSDGNLLYQYYEDLVTEVKLDAYVDGSTNIDADKPFGLYINLKHTQEIERESNGFQRYLVNQSNTRSGYNYGRPAEDYRDKFEESVRSALAENFEIVSLTFHSSKVQSRSDSKPGWTVTPYAYILLKPKGPQVDTIPPLKIDLDFLDTSGYVVLPITSPAIPISANAPDTERPHRDLKLTMVLDERKLEKDGNLLLEVKATGHGIIPPLDKLIQQSFEGFEVSNIEDRELQIVELDAESDDLAPISSHEWVISLKPIGDSLPASFSFPEPLLPLAKEDGLLRQRYDDVDLLSVEQTVELNKAEAASVNIWLYSAGAAILALLGFFFVKSRKPAPEQIKHNVIALPSDLTPVTLLSYLNKIRESQKLNADQKAKLDQEIKQLQTTYFGPECITPEQEQLKSIAQNWQKAI
ncbi:hypothetical protein Rhal01_00873 [Rubritalea halochordaticola]|uniref:Uncharacterized protein n=1 Tax=Rubritalea halochordaticola TaxID=714537 RepID=A0ABP9UYE8_9BACT